MWARRMHMGSKQTRGSENVFARHTCLLLNASGGNTFAAHEHPLTRLVLAFRTHDGMRKEVEEVLTNLLKKNT